MREGGLKATIRCLFFQEGSVRRIRLGPLRGMLFRVGPVTGLSPWYSGVERGHQRFFQQVVRPGDVVVDVGANWGVHTLLLSWLVGPEGRVVAVEPFPLAFAELQWHLQANGCSNVKTVPIALGDVEGEAPFVAGDSASTGRLLTGGSPATIAKDLTVSVRTLDSVVEEMGIGHLKLVKIDVEGAEGKVLSGATKAIQRFRPYFVIDLHTPEQDVLVASLLTRNGYAIQRLSGPPILRTDVGWPHSDGVWGAIRAIPPS